MKVLEVVILFLAVPVYSIFLEDFNNFYSLYDSDAGSVSSDDGYTQDLSFQQDLFSGEVPTLDPPCTTSDNFTKAESTISLMETLQSAAVQGFLKILSVVDPSINDSMPLRFAAERGHVKVVQHLLADPRYDPAALNNEAFYGACHNGHLEIVKLLLADARVQPGSRYKDAINNACKQADIDLLEILLNHPKSNQFAKLNNEFRAACVYGDSLENLRVIRLLLSDHRVNPGSKHNEAIREASLNGHHEVFKLLLAHPKVDPRANNNEAIRQACLCNHFEVVKLLLADGRADPAVNNSLIIWRISSFGHHKVAQLLLDDGRIDPSANESRALQTACEKGHLQVIELLFADPRVDPSAKNNEALRKTCQQYLFSDRRNPSDHLDRYKIAKLILSDSRVDPSATDNEAIRRAAHSGFYEIVKLLLSFENVDPSANDNEAIREASHRGHYEIVSLLLRHPKVDPYVVRFVLGNDKERKTKTMQLVFVVKAFEKMSVEELKTMNLKNVTSEELETLIFRHRDNPELLSPLFKAMQTRLFIPEHMRSNPVLHHFTNTVALNLPISLDELQHRVWMISSMSIQPFTMVGIGEIDGQILYEWSSSKLKNKLN